MNTMLALFDLGGGQILLILALILIFFGARRIPELAKGLGQGIKEFKKATRDVQDEIQNATAESPPPSSSPNRQLTSTPPPEKPEAVPEATEQKG